jgi:uncharacterized protein (TIGR02145 family)
MSESENDHNQGSGWGAIGAFGRRTDTHGDTARSFSIFTIFFILLAVCGVGYHTYYQVYGAVTIQSSLQNNVNLADGLVAYWTFDSSTIETIDYGGGFIIGTSTDMSPNGNDASLVCYFIASSGCGADIGVAGQGISLANNSNQKINITYSASHENLSAISVSAWVRPAQYKSSHIISKGDGTSSISNGWMLRMESSGAITFAIDYSTTDLRRVTAASLWKADEWNNIQVVWDGSTSAANAKIYINGTEATYVTTQNAVGSRVSEGTREIRIGNSSGGSSNYHGALDDIRLFNRTLNSAEIQALYSQGVGTKVNTTQTPSNLETGLVGHWTFDGPDMTTATATDVSGNGNDGSIIGIKATQGKIGQAITGSVFSNTINTYANINSLPQMTVSFWGRAITIGTIDRVRWIITPRTNSFRFSRVTSGIPGVWDVAFSDKGSSWVHYVVTYDSSSLSNDPKIYIDGISQSVTETFTPSGTISSETNQLYTLPNLLNGTLDDVRIYNRALSADEVAQLYTLGGGSKIEICRESAVQDADGNWYNTVAIGSQCWLDRNMDVGTRIPSFAAPQSDNGTIEKYCYNESDSNCTTNNPNKPDGGLYQWNEAMQYSTAEGAQGICPSGFHIPTDAEWHTLEKFLTDSGQSCLGNRNGSQSCASAGTKLQPGGSSRFEGNSGGFIDGGSSGDRGALGYWWSSTQSDGTAFNRAISASGALVYRLADSTTLAESVRCVQD